MMSKTHIAVGVAASMAIMHPTNVEGCLLAVSGGAVGGILADVDILKGDTSPGRDAITGQLIGTGITVVAFLLDFLLKTGICKEVVSRSVYLLVPGIIIYAGSWIVGFCSEHRTITHSLLAAIIFSAAVYGICPKMAIPFFAGYASHLVLDLFNKKKLRILFPLKWKICFGLCYADGDANTILMYAGLAVSVFLILNSVLLHLF